MNALSALSVLLIAQADPVSGLADLLQTYGPWGLCAVLMGVVALLFRKYVEARDKNDEALTAQIRATETQVKGATELIEEYTRASTEQTHALQNVAEALRTIERRLDRHEKG